LICPEVKITRDELWTIVSPNRFWITKHLARLVESLDDVFPLIAEARINSRGEPRERIDHSKHTQPASCDELIEVLSEHDKHDGRLRPKRLSNHRQAPGDGQASGLSFYDILQHGFVER
jgi:hypothetical protein